MFVLSHAYTCAIPGASFPTYPPSHHRTAIPQSAPLNMLVLSYVYTRVTSGAHLFLRILPRTIVRQYPNPAHLTCSYSRAGSGVRIPPWPSFRALARAYTPITPPAVPNTPRTHIRASRPGAALSPTYPLFTVTLCDSNVSRPARTFLHFVIAFASRAYAITNAPYLMRAYSRTHTRASRPGAAFSHVSSFHCHAMRFQRVPPGTHVFALRDRLCIQGLRHHQRALLDARVYTHAAIRYTRALFHTAVQHLSPIHPAQRTHTLSRTHAHHDPAQRFPHASPFSLSCYAVPGFPRNARLLACILICAYSYHKPVIPPRTLARRFRALASSGALLFFAPATLSSAAVAPDGGNWQPFCRF